MHSLKSSLNTPMFAASSIVFQRMFTNADEFKKAKHIKCIIKMSSLSNISPIVAELVKTAPTELCTIMDKHGSDKGLGWHNYTTVYTHIFDQLDFKNKSNVNIFEVGLGTNNINLPSNMGINGKPGASLKGWSEYFQNANIFGADIDKDILDAIRDEKNRIDTFYVDQCSAETIRSMWVNPRLLDKKYDLFVDDGLHTFEAASTLLRESHHVIKENGVYIVEDIHLYDIDKYLNMMPQYKEWFKHAEILVIPHATNTLHNNILILQK